MNAADFVRAILFLVCVPALIGCGTQDYEIAQVDGVLLIAGRPADMVRIEFAPDGVNGARGPTSSAETDAEGRFSLSFFERHANAPESGAVVGSHRVTLADLRMAASATGRDVKRRFGQEYGLVSTTPLKLEIKPGAQKIDLEIP